MSTSATTGPSHVVSYKSTTIACYIGIFCQAIVINLTPILFIPLREQYGLTFMELGLLIFVNFTTQVVVDIAFSKVVEKHGYRPFVVASHGFTVIGFLLFALAPTVLASPYPGFLIATVIFSAGGGLQELLLSPIVNSIPTGEKEKAMSVLHSCYAWGQVSVVVGTTLLVFSLGRESWQWIMVAWTILPALNFVNFMKVPLGSPVPENGEHMGLGKLAKEVFFIIAIVAIAAGGAAEITMSGWTSAFFEKTLNIPKAIGDMTGVAAFAFMLGLGRLLYGKLGARMPLPKVMMAGALLAVACYLVVVFSTVNAFALIACMMCGFGVSLLWPGTLVLAAKRFPQAGASMFAILAAGGDIGASVGPWIVSLVADSAGALSEQLGLRMGILVGVSFPIIAFVCLRLMALLDGRG
ncbi:MAG: MFS transporter [Candidatus Lokiarchaeota archaeon]|nr:MFS transporter [Candidatus Lokiarchaeota archaeon]